MSPEEIRARVVQIASSVVGLGGDPADPSRRERYLDFIAAGESAAQRRDMGAMSPGGLIVAAVWRGIGVIAPELAPPYVTGSALSRLMVIARRAGAWVPFTPGARPGLGDVVYVGGKAGGAESVYSIVAITPGDPLRLSAVSGQMITAGKPSIVATSHRWGGDRDTMETSDGSDDTRGVNGWIDVTRLPGLDTTPLSATHPLTPPASPGPDLPLEPIRVRAVAAAKALVGLSENPKDADKRALYLSLIAPSLTPGQAAELSCRAGNALVIAGIYRAIGLRPVPEPSIAARPSTPDPVAVKLPAGLRSMVASRQVSSLVSIVRGSLEVPTAAKTLEAFKPEMFARLRTRAVTLDEIAAPPAKVALPPPSQAHALALEIALPHAVMHDLATGQKAHGMSPVAPVEPTSPTPPSATAAAVDAIKGFSDYLRMLRTGRIDGADARALRRAAEQLGAFTPFVDGALPRPGDVVFAGTEGASAGRLFMVTARNGSRFQSVDGGLRDAEGHAIIGAREHAWLDHIDVVTTLDGLEGTGPLLIDGWIDLLALERANAPVTPPVVTPPPETLRERAVRLALSFVGLGANPKDPDTRRDYLELVAPGETPGRQAEMAEMSGCALTVRGIWRALGFDEQELAAPYPTGMAVSHVYTLALRAHAWVPFALGAHPSPGDTVLVGDNTPHQSEHVYTVTAVSTASGAIEIESVDGGQVDGDHQQTISAKTRSFQANRDVVLSPGQSEAGRKIQGWVNLDKLATLLDGAPHTEQPPQPLSGSWVDYASTASTAHAGAPVPPALLAAIAARRGAIPKEPHLVSTNVMRGGHMYTGNEDTAHHAYLDGYLAAKPRPSRIDGMKIDAFRALLRREGSTSSINTYDNMVVTWGMGFAGPGPMASLMPRIMASSAARELFEATGVGFWGEVYHVVDLDAGRVVSGLKPALQIVRASTALLCTLIHAARDPATRAAVADAQFDWFVQHSASHDAADEIETQALFTFVTHLKHWAPYYAMGAVAWAAAQAPGPRSEARDRVLAPLIGRYFYGRTRGFAWVPAWSQLQHYALVDMKADGLDCAQEGWFTGAGPTDLPDVG